MSQQAAEYYATMAARNGSKTIPEILDGNPEPLFPLDLKLPIGALDKAPGLAVAAKYGDILASLGTFVLAMANPDDVADLPMQGRTQTWQASHVNSMPRKLLKPDYLDTGSLNTITTRAVTPDDFSLTFLKQALHLRTSDEEALRVAARAVLLVTTALIEPPSEAHVGYTGFVSGVFPIAGRSLSYRGRQFTRTMLSEQSDQWHPRTGA